MKLILDSEFVGPWDRAQKWLLARQVNAYEPYQPVVVRGRTLAEGERNCMDRWSIIQTEMASHMSKTLLDLGCAEGYFVQRAAAAGAFALGVDADIRRLSVARMTTTFNRISGAAFVQAMLSPELVDRLPQSDAVLFLSVLHHVMYERGVDYSRELLSAICTKTKQFLVFDMGQSNETQHKWSALLPDMGSDPTQWIGEFLSSCGYSSVKAVGPTDAYKSDVKRVVFIARP